MSKIREYIEIALKEESTYPGHLKITSREFQKVNELYDHLNDSRLSITSYTSPKNNPTSHISYPLNGDSIDLFYLLKKRISRIKLLQIYCTDIPSIQILSLLHPFTSLIHLRLDMIPPSTVRGLYELRFQLQSLEITNSGITDLHSIFMPEAYQDDQLIRSLKPIASSGRKYVIPKEYLWVQLISLKLSNCGLSRLDPSFHFMPSLASLSLEKNQISDVIHLQDCYRLKFLNLSFNRVSRVSNLHLVLGNLKVLDLSNNKIEYLDGINKLYSIQQIDLSINCIEDIDEISLLAKLPNLESIDLYGNDIAKNLNYRLNVFTQFFDESGTYSTNKNFPILDGESIQEYEIQRFKGIMFRSLEDDDKQTSLTKSIYSSMDQNDLTVQNTTSHGNRNGSISANTSANSNNSNNSGSNNRNSISYIREDKTMNFVPSIQQSMMNDQKSSTQSKYGMRLLFSPPVLSKDMISIVSDNTKYNMDYRLRCNSMLLEGWTIKRRKRKESILQSKSSSGSSPSMESNPSANYTINNRLNNTHPTHMTRLVHIENRDEEVLKIYPTLDEIKESVRIRREKNRLENKFSNTITSNTKTSSNITTNQSNHNNNNNHHNNRIDCKYVEIVDERALSVETRRNIIGRLSSEDSFSPINTDNSIDFTESNINQENSSNSNNNPFMKDTNPFLEDSKQRDNLISIPTGANLDLDMNDMMSLRSDDLAGSSIDQNSQNTISVLLPSATHHDHHIGSTLSGPTSLGNSTISSIQSTSTSTSQYNSQSNTPYTPYGFEILPLSNNITPRASDMPSIPKNFEPMPIMTNMSSGISVSTVISPRNSDLHSTTHLNSNLNSTSNSHLHSNPHAIPKSKIEVEEETLRFNSRIYSGAEEYSSLNVIENLELYFREQVFGIYKSTGDAPYIRYDSKSIDSPHHKTSEPKIHTDNSSNSTSNNNIEQEDDDIHFIEPPSRSERFMALFHEYIVPVERRRSMWRPPFPGQYITGPERTTSAPNVSVDSNRTPSKSSLSVLTKPTQLKNSGNNYVNSSSFSSKLGQIQNYDTVEQKLIIALTNVTVYFLRYDEFENGVLFRDAPIPTLVCSHPVVDLMYCTIFFGFQRCMLSFASLPSTIFDTSNINTSRHYAFIEYNNVDIPEEYLTSYIIVTRDKSHTYPIITKIPQISNAARGLIASGNPYRNVRISNKDNELLNKVMDTAKSLGSHDPDVVYYQMLSQIWRKHPGVALPRTVILTPTLLLLCDEDLASQDVSLSIIDHATVKDIYKIQVEDDPHQLTIILKPSSKGIFSVRRKWRLQADAVTVITRLHDECKRLCLEHGNHDV